LPTETRNILNTSMKIESLPGIYKITNKLNGRSYIGQSIDVLARIKTHKRKSRKLVINKAIQKYGVSSFVFEVIIYCEVSLLDEYEKALIVYHNTISPHGYNIEVGGKDRHMVESTKEKLSNMMKGRHVGENNPFYGKSHSEEVKKIISEANVGKIISEEHRKVVAKSASTRKGELSYWYGKEPPFKGKSHSEKSRNKIGDAERGALNHCSVPVIISGVRYSCQAEAASSIGVAPNTIRYRVKSSNSKYSDYSYAKNT